MTKPQKLEILAPAGNIECALAAADAGADAVYFGLRDFNARRNAENIPFDKLQELVKKLHERNVKAYLALNTDISQRELAEAARYLAFAKFANIDAVIIKDLCFIEILRYIGKIPIHFSTQAAISSSTGAKFAKELSIKRIVLAREMNADEIKATASKGIEVEVFVQGAMCFSISGRCMLSSWIGGRSGNRGLCASPCRMEWTNLKTLEKSRLMSMKDLSLLNHIEKLSQIGVSSIKIEGRLKTPEWTAKAVQMVRAVRDEKITISDASALGIYAGREMTDSFFTGKNTDLIADSARFKSSTARQETDTNSQKPNILEVSACEKEGKISIQLSLKNPEISKIVSDEITLKIRDTEKKKNLINFKNIIESIRGKFSDLKINENSSIKNILMSPSDLLKIENSISALIHKISKESKETLKFPLPDELISKIRTKKNTREFRRNKIGFEFTRISAKQIPLFNEYSEPSFIVESTKLKDAISAKNSNLKNFIIALPQVFYEKDIHEISSIINFCSENKIQTEINNLDAIPIAIEAQASWSAGPGLMVLNSFSAEVLKSKGALSATISLEADKTKIEELVQSCELPLLSYIFGRPKLMQSRCALSEHEIRASERRGLEIALKHENNITSIYPIKPFRVDLPPNFPVFFAIDLVRSPDPICEFRNWRKVDACDFNFSGRLK